MADTPVDFEALRKEMLSREPLPSYERLAEKPLEQLVATLAPFVPKSWLQFRGRQQKLPPASHLIYFNPAIREDELLADGTDPLQSPGAPFIRRMWAGGNLRFRLPEEYNELNNGLIPKDIVLKPDGRTALCLERVRDVIVKGPDGEEKVYVGIERRFACEDPADEKSPQQERRRRMKEKLWREDEDDMGDSMLIERRNIVFMRERTPEQLKKIQEKGASGTKILRGIHDSLYTVGMICLPLFHIYHFWRGSFFLAVEN
jgi:hypothetical protein